MEISGPIFQNLNLLFMSTLQQAAFIMAKVLELAEQNPDGFTIHSNGTEAPTEGVCVALAETQNSFGLHGLFKALSVAVEKNLHFGGWLENTTGKFYWDAVRLFPENELEEALEFARNEGQISVFVLSTFKIIYVNG
jgi:hypothetical protein